MSRFYITTAIPYANGAPHIGHAYERIATDAIQRFMRLDGRETLFVTGMDEHGLKVQQAAAREGVTPQQFVDRVAAEFEAMGEMLNARADDIVRTTQPRHDRASQAIWERMAANGDIYLSKYSGWYSVRDEAYFDESELTDGPDGTKLAPSGAPVEWVEEESYFFRLSAYADKLLAHYEAHPEFVTPENYRNEIVAFVKRGLVRSLDQPRDLQMGRARSGRPEARDVCLGRRADQLHHRDRLPGRWPAGEILAGGRACDRQGHHALPRHLLAGVPDVGRPARAETGRRARLPVQPRRENVEVGRQRRRPESDGRGLRPRPVRYFFLREVPFGQDGSYSHEAIVARMNADLANDIGNLAQRSLTMIAKAGARTPDWREATPAKEDLAMLARADALLGEARRHMQSFALQSLHRRRFRGRVGGQSLFRQRRALEARQERSGAHGARALRDDRNLAHRRDPAAAGDAGEHGRRFSTSSASRRRPAHSRRWTPASGLASSTRRIGSSRAGRCPPPAPVFPRYVEAEAAK